MPAHKITPLKRALILQLAPLYTDGAIAELLGERASTVKWHRHNEPKTTNGLASVDRLASFAIKEAITQAHTGSLTSAADALESAANRLRQQAEKITQDAIQ